MFERDAFGASACLLCFCPRLSLTAMYNILLKNTTVQTKKEGKASNALVKQSFRR